VDDQAKWLRKQRAYTKRLELKERAIALKGGKCQGCGYDRCPAAMDFHHPDAFSKDLSISSVMSWKRIEAELPKTILLCANCHREAHAGWLLDLVEHLEGRELGEDLPP